MSRPPRDTLEDFALKGMHLAKMTGASVATHAVKDGFLLMHTGVGCKFKTAAQVAQHDWSNHPNRREAWTQVGEVSLIRGSGGRIGPFARSWFERRRPGIMVVVSAYFIELTGEDIKDIVVETERSLPCPMASVSTSAPNKGFFDGYASTMLEMVKKLDWKSPPTKLRQAAVLGFFFHRYEPDQQADLAQLKALIKVAGLEPGPVLFSGRPWEELAEAPAAGVVVQLPYVDAQARGFKRLLKRRDVVRLDLPIGIAATSRFVRELAAATGGDPARTEAWIEGQVSRILPHLGQVTNNFQGLAVAVFADTPLAAGLVSMLREMGAKVVLIGLRDTSLGGAMELRRVVDANGQDLGDAEVLERPSLMALRERVIALAEAREVHAVIGSSIELNVFTHAASVRAALQRVALLETGFPSKDHHSALALPTFGYQGALVWAQRIVDGVLGPRIGARPRA